ncbi:hypothetical protein O181_051436 [Austropuccinia psidii MF-1]|uniref:Uncharacterized protein n=1 Tax=Austropuccinia psidii MF-1 TaxID=1389203 RepID=A0A9Q3HNC4_9BASI|nr:hypothetical protein [Austropuccinia psidii MF-1]
MSSSDPHKSHSGHVHDFNSESRIEYAQIKSQMSPKIPLKTPISSSMIASGLNIDVGIVMAQTSSTWSIQNISITPIPLNPTNTQMHVSEGPGSTPQILSKANPQSKFPDDFLLNPGWNPVVSQELFGQSKQPNLKIPPGSQVNVGHENWVDGGQIKKMVGKCYSEWSFRGKYGIDTSSK